ncbi:MAG: hypothetical protein BJ554DRAFT_5738, partial [Olpidium bornovanus]
RRRQLSAALRQRHWPGRLRRWGKRPRHLAVGGEPQVRFRLHSRRVRLGPRRDPNSDSGRRRRRHWRHPDVTETVVQGRLLVRARLVSHTPLS